MEFSSELQEKHVDFFFIWKKTIKASFKILQWLSCIQQKVYFLLVSWISLAIFQTVAHSIIMVWKTLL